MERDVIISKGLEAIENKIKELVKPEENYKFKTNCKYNNENLKVLPVDQLIKILAEIYMMRDYMDKVSETFYNVLEDKDRTYKLYDFTVYEWSQDISYLIKKNKYNEKLKTLEAKAEALKKYYSEDKQVDIAIKDILASL
jgi:hypothetical protein